MKEAAFLVTMALLLGCASAADREEAKLMTLIEDQVKLPEGAFPLDSYARYYAKGSRGDVIGIYVQPRDYSLKPGEACEELDENLSGRVVPCEIELPDWYMPAGRRRWMKDERESFPSSITVDAG